MKTKRLILSTGICFPLFIYTLLTSCAMVVKVATFAGQSAGVVNEQQAQSINKSANALEKTFEDISPQQEYFIGRAVAAMVMSIYQPSDNTEFNHYLNLIGQTLAAESDHPVTFGGYHFCLLNADEINAFAAPGGLIMVSRGMVRCCKSEDALAAVLAHEIGHVEKCHGLKAIKTGRLTSALTILAAEGAKNLGNDQLTKLTEEFEGSISDITSTMMNSGYSRGCEFDADKEAVTIMKRVGYNTHALIELLQQMKKDIKPGSPGFAKTHPDPQDRIKAIKRLCSKAHATPVETRRFRFANAMAVL